MRPLLFTCLAAIVKSTADEIPPGQAVFFRSFFAIPIILIWLAQRGQLKVGLKAKNPMGHVWRGVFGTTAMGLQFSGQGMLHPAEMTAIGFATPIFTVILAAVSSRGARALIRQRLVTFGLREGEQFWCVA